MAGFRQHVTVSSALGVGYAAAAYFLGGVSPAPCLIAGGLTALGGMLPDLDSPTGQPVREVLGFTAAVAPLLLLKRIGFCMTYLAGVGIEIPQTFSSEALVVLMTACYLAVRFGGAWLLETFTVHRGMFHSIPAAFIVASSCFLLGDLPGPTRWLLALGALIGFFSHLFMDELWSIEWSGGMLGFKKSFGTALKLFSGSMAATAATYAVLLGMGYVVTREPSFTDGVAQLRANPTVQKVAAEWSDTTRR